MRTYRKQSGFSLTEIMVGMTVGLIMILVILQTMSLFETQRSRSNGASDMQNSGLLALYTLEQETAQAGYGMMMTYQGIGDLPCLQINGFGNPAGVFYAIPIVLTTSGTMDSVTLSRIDSAYGGLMTGGGLANVSTPIAAQADLVAASGIRLSSASGVFKPAGVIQTVATYPASAVDASNLTYKVTSAVADTVLISSASGVVPKNACTLMAVNKFVSGAAYVPEQLNASGVSVQSAVQAFTTLSFSHVSNVGLNTALTPTFASYPQGTALMHNLGPSPTLRSVTFSVDGSGQFLQITNGVSSVVTSNIVNMQTQYGVAPAGSQTINCWVNPTAANTNPASTACPAGDAADWTQAGLMATPANIKRIKAIRVALVARNNVMEKAKNGVCSATATAPISWLNGPLIDLTANPDWQCYRYKVYQTIIPLNNVLLGNL